MKKFTLVVHCENDKLPQWVYDGHLNGSYINGIRAETIHNGDAVEKYYEYLERLEGDE